jgi:hypothetical protein
MHYHAHAPRRDWIGRALGFTLAGVAMCVQAGGSRNVYIGGIDDIETFKCGLSLHAWAMLMVEQRGPAAPGLWRVRRHLLRLHPPREELRLCQPYRHVCGVRPCRAVHRALVQRPRDQGHRGHEAEPQLCRFQDCFVSLSFASCSRLTFACSGKGRCGRIDPFFARGRRHFGNRSQRSTSDCGSAYVNGVEGVDGQPIEAQ